MLGRTSASWFVKNPDQIKSCEYTTIEATIKVIPNQKLLTGSYTLGTTVCPYRLDKMLG